MPKPTTAAAAAVAGKRRSSSRLYKAPSEKDDGVKKSRRKDMLAERRHYKSASKPITSARTVRRIVEEIYKDKNKEGKVEKRFSISNKAVQLLQVAHLAYMNKVLSNVAMFQKVNRPDHSKDATACHQVTADQLLLATKMTHKEIGPFSSIPHC